MKRFMLAAILATLAVPASAATINEGAPLCQDRWGMQGLFAARSLGWLATGSVSLADYGCRAAKAGQVQVLQTWPSSYVVMVQVGGRRYLTISTELR